MYILSLLEIGQYIPQNTPTMTQEQGTHDVGNKQCIEKVTG